ncbi:MAG: heat-inducible transcription repressor HrcA [Ignavibacteriales bacterium]|nr:MAG: heat-inducible transcription repressor HrcA [Ignavibacteriales bacterium]
MMNELNDREKSILRSIVHQFILTAAPVGSRNIVKKYDLGFSPATVRNIMSDLEESGYINHPHTSAGRIPTDKGYRFYVDTLMDIRMPDTAEVELINRELEISQKDTDEILNLTSNILSKITNQIACVTYPRLDTGVLEKIQLVSLSSIKVLVVISIKSGLVKTITLELLSEIKPSQINEVQNLLNERLSGLTFAEIRNTFGDRFRDVIDDHKSIIRLFVDSVDKIFRDFKQNDRLVLTGAKNVIKQPEFEDPGKFQSIIELIEDKDIIIHILEKSGEMIQDQVFISIGSENEDRKLNEYSFVSKEYSLGGTSGTLGIIGPKRMEYPKVVAIVDYVAKMLSELLTNTNSK